MSSPVQIPADVEHDEAVWGRLTARQLAVLAVTAATVYGLWRVLGPDQLAWFLTAAVPLAVAGIAMMFGRRDGTALDVVAVAGLRQWLSMRPLARGPRVTASAVPGASPGGRGHRRLVAVGPLLRGVRTSGSDGIGVLDLGADGSAVVCAVAPVNMALRAPGEQDAVVAGFARWLHSLAGPVQIVTRTRRLDLSGPITRLRRDAPRLGNPALAAAAVGHAEDLAAMGEHTELLHHEFLIVFRDPTASTAGDTGEDLADEPAGGVSRRGAVAVEALRRRAGEATALLGPLGLQVTPLPAEQAALVLQRALAPAALTPPAPSPPAAPPTAGLGGRTDPLERSASSGRWFDPGWVLVRPRRVFLGGVWSATVVVTGYPREVAGAGWLAPLTGHPGLVDVSLHITPVDPVTAAGRLRRRLARLESARRSSSQHDRLPDPHVDAAAEDAQLLADRVARGETKLFTTTLTVTVTASTEADLDADLASVRAVLASLLITAHPAGWRAWRGWQSGLPLGVDRIGSGRILDTMALAAAFPFASPDLPPPASSTNPVPTDLTASTHDSAGRAETTATGGGGVFYGYNLASASLVFWDRFAGDNYNAVILGRSGAGKSYLTKLELLRSLYAGVHAQVIDPEDEYARLADAVGATVVRVGAAGVRINPLDLDIHVDATGRRTAAPDALARRRMTLHSFLALALTTTLTGDTSGGPGAGAGGGSNGSLGEGLTSSERAVLDEAITSTYRRAGITDDPATWTRSAPLLRDLYLVLAATSGDDVGEQSAVDPAGTGVVDKGANGEPDEALSGVDASRQDDGRSQQERTPGRRYESTREAADLARRLRPFVDGAFSGLFDGPTSHRGVGAALVVWSLRELPEQLRSLATMLVLDAIWRTVTHPHDRRRRLVVVDEAWLLLQHPAGARFLLRAAKAGRKHWCGLTVTTQDIADVLSSDLGRAIITNSATQVLLRQAPQVIDQIARVFGLSAGERALLLTAERGHGLLTGGQHRAAFAALASAREDELITTDPAALALHTHGPEWISLDPPPAQPEPVTVDLDSADPATVELSW